MLEGGLIKTGIVGEEVQGAIVIEDGVWIGTGATIVAGAHIGRGAVVAAGSVVVGEVPANSLVAGVPAVVKKQFAEESAESL